MLDQYTRLRLVLGEENVSALSQKRVALFGLGGVGGNAAEALARSGIGTLDVIDSDRFTLTNLNRQLYALRSTVGRFKVDVAAERIRDIDPQITVHTHRVFYLPETADQFDFAQYDYIVDAIDTVTAKLRLIAEAGRCGTPVISVMGCGNRIDPSKLIVTDIYSTSQDPLARIMRRELRKLGIAKLKVVCSTEPAIRPERRPEPLAGLSFVEEQEKRRRDVPGSTAFVPPAAGILAASQVVADLLAQDPHGRD